MGEITKVAVEWDPVYRGYRIQLPDGRPIAYIIRPLKKRRIEWFKVGFRIITEQDEKLEPIHSLLISAHAVREGVIKISREE